MIDERKIDIIRRQKSPFKLADIFVFALVILLVVALLFSLYSRRGVSVMIVSGDTTRVVSLAEDTAIDIDGSLTVVISGGECYVRDAKCKNKLCERTGKISRVNESIVCSEKRIVITVISDGGDVAGEVGKG